MKRPPEIQINQFQLNALLNQEEKSIYELIVREHVFCNGCEGAADEGVTVKEIYLNDLNDVVIQGTCNECGGKVARIIEYGENKEFYERAMKFRKSIQTK